METDSCEPRRRLGELLGDRTPGVCSNCGQPEGKEGRDGPLHLPSSLPAVLYQDRSPTLCSALLLPTVTYKTHTGMPWTLATMISKGPPGASWAWVWETKQEKDQEREKGRGG